MWLIPCPSGAVNVQVESTFFMTLKGISVICYAASGGTLIFGQMSSPVGARKRGVVSAGKAHGSGGWGLRGAGRKGFLTRKKKKKDFVGP